MPRVNTSSWAAGDCSVGLRPLTVADCAGPYLNWMNDHESGRFIDGGCRDYSAEDLDGYVREVRARGGIHFGIFDIPNSRHVGNVSTSLLNRRHLYADVGILLAPEARGRGYGRRGFTLFVDYLFDVEGLNRIQLGVSEHNAAAIGLYERLGFKREGYSREQYLDVESGTYSGTISYGILRSEWVMRQQIDSRGAVT